MKTIFTLILCCITCCFTYADSEIGKVDSFDELLTIVQDQGAPTRTLLVMDNDATLTIMPCKGTSPDKCQYLGGPAWYAWQTDLLKTYINTGKDSPFRVAESETQLIEISGILLSLNNMDYTQQIVPDVLKKLTKQGVRLLVETARGTGNVAATAQQFSTLKAHDSSLLAMIQSNALHFPEQNIAALPSPYVPCDIPGSRNVSYSQGIMYVAGQNKGVMLDCMLTQYTKLSLAQGLGMPIEHIIFIDDTLPNVKRVHESFKHNPNYKVKALHYKATKKHKKNLTDGKMAEAYQQKANDRWQAIANALNSNLIKSTIE